MDPNIQIGPHRNLSPQMGTYMGAVQLGLLGHGVIKLTKLLSLFRTWLHSLIQVPAATDSKSESQRVSGEKYFLFSLKKRRNYFFSIFQQDSEILLLLQNSSLDYVIKCKSPSVITQVSGTQDAGNLSDDLLLATRLLGSLNPE